MTAALRAGTPAMKPQERARLFYRLALAGTDLGQPSPPSFGAKENPGLLACRREEPGSFATGPVLLFDCQSPISWVTPQT